MVLKYLGRSLFLLAISACPALAGEAKVAVAANFTAPAQEIAAKFEAATGDHILLSFGASGQFYAQISHSAPYEILLSADADRPIQAEKNGFAVPGTRFTYAVGKLVLWSPDASLVDEDGTILAQATFQHLAIADPKLAPYGAAAVGTMTRMGVYDDLKPKIVTGSSISQAFQFVKTGNAELGFVSLSQLHGKSAGSRWVVPEWLHNPIIQQAILLEPGAANPVAKAFLAYLKGPEAHKVIENYGYGFAD